MDAKTYIEKEIDACNFALEKEYQTCDDVIRVAELESRMQIGRASCRERV